MWSARVPRILSVRVMSLNIIRKNPICSSSSANIFWNFAMSTWLLWTSWLLLYFQVLSTFAPFWNLDWKQISCCPQFSCSFESSKLNLGYLGKEQSKIWYLNLIMLKFVCIVMSCYASENYSVCPPDKTLTPVTLTKLWHFR